YPRHPMHLALITQLVKPDARRLGHQTRHKKPVVSANVISYRKPYDMVFVRPARGRSARQADEGRAYGRVSRQRIWYVPGRELSELACRMGRAGAKLGGELRLAADHEFGWLVGAVLADRFRRSGSRAA